MSESPYYTQSSPLKNQGVFSGDGNQYRFSFSVYTGENIPGGVEGDTNLYYCFEISGNYDFNFDLSARRCWIKKTVFASMPVPERPNVNVIVRKYKSGSLVIFHQYNWYDPYKPVGVIHSGAPGHHEILWGMNPASEFQDEIFTDKAVERLQGYWTTATNNGTVYKDIFSLLFNIALNPDEDRIVAVQKEEQIAYNTVKYANPYYALSLILNENSIPTSLYVTVPQYYTVIKQYLSVGNKSQSGPDINSGEEDSGEEDLGEEDSGEEEEWLKDPKLSVEKGGFVGGSRYFVVPENTIHTPENSKLQCESFWIDNYNNNVLTNVEGILENFHSFCYSENLLSLLQNNGDKVTIYIKLTDNAEEGEDPDFSAVLTHVVGGIGQIPSAEEGESYHYVCTVKRQRPFSSSSNPYSEFIILPHNSDYSTTVAPGIITLTTPPREDHWFSINRREDNGRLQLRGFDKNEASEFAVENREVDHFLVRSVFGGSGYLDYKTLPKELFEGIEPDEVSIDKNTEDKLEIAGWETQPVEESVDLTQTEFVARSEGGNLVYVDLSESMLEPDEVSIDKNTDDKLEIKGWGSEASIATPEDLTDLGFVCRDGTPEVNTLKFVKLDDLKTDVEVDDVTIEKDAENDDALQIKGFPSEDAVLLDFNDKGIQDGNENETEWAFLTRVTDGETDPYLQYTKHIAARYFLKGDEDNSLGVVRGVTAAEDETDDNPLVVRLAGVDAKPAATDPAGLQRVYGYSSAGHWGLFEIESLFKYDSVNKRFYIDLAGYTNFKSLSDDATAFDFNSDANIDGKNGATFDVVTDVAWDSSSKELVVKKRTVTLFKFGLKSISAASPTETEIETGGQFDVRYDASSAQLQKSTDGGTTWTMISGGQAVAETV